MDEAGRGAVLGPLVVAGVVVEEAHLPRLSDLGFRDSKTLSRDRRRALARALGSCGARGRVVVIPAAAVDAANLTDLELEATAALVRRLSPGTVVMDTPVGLPAIPRFRGLLAARAGLPPAAVSVVPKADRDHPAAAAASVLAKAVRDGYVLLLRKHYGDFGWGYPGEEKVKSYLQAWISAHGTPPPFGRARWRPVRDLLSGPLLESAAGCGSGGTRGEWAPSREKATRRTSCPSEPTNPTADAGTACTGSWPGCGPRPGGP